MGEILINFSSPLRSRTYKDILANFEFFGKIPNTRRLLQEDSGSSQS